MRQNAPNIMVGTWNSMSASNQCKPMRYTLPDAGVIFSNHKPKANQRDGSFGLLLACADQKLLCLQWKCGLGLGMALSVDAWRGSAPCRWAFPGVLFIIKKMLERNFGNFEKKIILTTKTIPTMQRNKKTFKWQNIYIGICPQQTKRTVPLVCESAKNDNAIA